MSIERLGAGVLARLAAATTGQVPVQAGGADTVVALRSDQLTVSALSPYQAQCLPYGSATDIPIYHSHEIPVYHSTPIAVVPPAPTPVVTPPTPLTPVPPAPTPLVQSQPPATPAPTPQPAPAPNPTPAPKPTPSPQPPTTIGHKVSFASVADPHVTSGDGRKFDNARVGDFILAQSKSGDLVVQARNDKLPGESGTWQTQAAIKTNGDVVSYDAATNRLTINGKAYAFQAGKTIRLPGGGTVAMTQDTLDNGTPFSRVHVHTRQGDDLYMLDFARKKGGHELDLSGSISGDRARHDVTGALGAMDGDGDASDDLRTRTGAVTQDVASFLESWRVKAGESLLS